MANQHITIPPAYPPVVSVLGHVDHGKTSLLDVIRKTTIAQREHGGITQKIGASTIEIIHEGIKRKITFIDTPGHEAFANMRSRGAQVADIGLLIVSAVDGVMPQTKEAIYLLQSSHIPFIAVLTKSDLPEKNGEKVKQQLLKEKVMLEEYGGDVPIIEVSSKTGFHVKDLLDLILLVNDLHPKTTISENDYLRAVIIESKKDAKTGPLATVVIKNGTVHVRDELITETAEAKVRALITDQGEHIQTATIGAAVEILGFKDVPTVGSIVYHKAQQKEKKSLQEGKQEEHQEKPVIDKEHAIPLILCADTQGSLEAIVSSLPEPVRIVMKKTGEISEGDIIFAKSTGAIILTFNIKIRNDTMRFARQEKVLLKNYTIIYELLDELKEVVEGKRLALLEQIYGVAKILASFPFEKSTVLGISVLDGRIARGDKVRIVRGEDVIGESHIVSLKQGKTPMSKVEKGQEAGILLSPFQPFQTEDLIVSHS